MKNQLKLLVLFLLFLALTSCKPFIRPEQPFQTNLIHIENGQPIGQTFTARYNGLESIVLYLEPGDSEEGSVNLHLRSNTKSDTDLRFSSISNKLITKPGYYTFQFPAIDNSSQSEYYFFLKNKGDSTLSIGTADYYSYLNGTLHIDHIPQDAQLFFRLVYDPTDLAVGLLKEGLFWLLWLAVAFFLFVIPGWALLLVLLPAWKTLYWGVKLGLALGVSLALYPVLFLWTDLINLHLGPLYAWLPPILSLGVIFWYYRKQISQLQTALPKISLSKLFHSPNFWPNLILVMLIGGVFAIRFWVVRTLDIPLWGDSYQHTMIVQLLVDNGGLFSSWEPYAELQTLTYHFGFHAITAVFQWVTNLPVPQAVLIMGQILNGIAVIALLPLAQRINSNRWTGVLTVLIAGLLLQMPMFYVNWGRYTQLTAQAILPTAIFLAWFILESKPANQKLLVLSWITWAGLALTHYRVLVFAVLFFPAAILLKFRQSDWKRLGLNTFWLGLGAGAIFLPWFVQVFSGKVINIFGHHISSPADQLPAVTVAYNSIGDLTVYLPRFIWLILPIILAWGFWRREKNFTIISLWSFLVFLAANPQWFHLRGAGILTNFAVFIAAYIPASLFLAAALGWLIEKLETISGNLRLKDRKRPDLKPAFTLIFLLTVIVLSFYGLRQRIHDIEINDRVFVTDPDQRAFKWVQENTPAESNFLVNSFPAFGKSLIAGADAGWWIPLLADRQTSQPPLIYGTEQGPRPDYLTWIKFPTFEILRKGITHPDVLNLLEERQINYVFIGQQRGRINNPTPYLQPETLLSDPHFELAYHQDGVWIFRILY